MSVFHLDIEAFMTGVERVKQPGLALRPLVIAPEAARAEVLAASPDAKQLGIARGMPLVHLRKHFPGVCVIRPNPVLYDRAQRYVLGLAGRFSPIVEPAGYGHVALDMSGTTRLYGSLECAALKLMREIREGARLPATVGIAANKLVSTIAAKEIQKHREVLHRVEIGGERKFLAPLPCKALPEWRERFVRRLLFELNLSLIDHVQAIPRELLSFAMGALGASLHRHALGIDPQPVIPPRQSHELAAEHRFYPDTNDDEVLRSTLFRLLEELCFQLRAKGMAAGRLRVSLAYSDDVNREAAFKFAPGRQEQVLHQMLWDDRRRWLERRQRIRYLRVGLGGLGPYQQQLSLFDVPKPKRLSPHVDTIRRRFGASAIQLGRGLAAQPPQPPPAQAAPARLQQLAS